MSDRIARVLLPLILLAASAGATAQTIPDTAFGGLGTGFVNLPLNQGGLDRDIGNDMKTRPDGRIVIAGSAQTATGLVAAVYQLTPDGLPDPTFGGGDGRATFADPNAPTDALLIHALAIQSDGKIVLAGTRNDGSSLAMRINADGTALDAGFGSGGFAPVGASEFRDVAIDSDGRIVCVGEQAIINPVPPHDGWTRIAVTRLTTTGALDTSFAGTGRPYYDFGTNDTHDYRGRAVVIDHNDRILVAAEVWTPDHGNDFGVLGLLPNGTPDPNFGNYGPVGRARVHFDQTGAGCTDDRIADIAIHHSTVFPQNDRILLAGTACSSDGNRDFGIARLFTSGELDVAFGGAGRQLVAFDLDAVGFDSATAIAFQSIGLALFAPTHLVVAGIALRETPGTNYDIALARLRLSDGNIDPTFGNGGRLLQALDLGGPDTDWVESVVVTSTRITIAGWVSTPLNSGNDRDFLAARYIVDNRIFGNSFEP